jgi:hypothetical protein
LKAYIDVQQYLAANMISVTGMPNGVVTTFNHPWQADYTVGESGIGGNAMARVWVKQ